MNVVLHPGAKLTGSLKSSGSSTQYEQRAVTLNTEITQGYGEYEYQYTEVYNGKSEVVQKYSEQSAYSFQTRGVGVHTYYVDVKDGSGQSLRLSYKMEVRKAPAPAPMRITLKSNKSMTEYSARDIELTATATGGNGGYEYEFTEIYGGKSKVVQNFGSQNTYHFRTKELGSHTYKVKVKDKSGATAEDSFSMTVVAHPTAILEGTFTTNSSGYEYIDRKIVLTTALTKEGYGDCEYQFSRVYNGEEEIIKGYSVDNTCTFLTDQVGRHTFYVTIKDMANQTIKIPCDKVVDVVAHPTIQIQGTLTSNKSNYEYSSRDIVLTANVTKEGYGDCQYQFVRVYDGASKVVQQYSSKNTHSFKTGLPGEYIYYVNIKDRAGLVLQLSYFMTVVSNGTFDKGIDVSSYQGNINWSAVKASGITFAMLRVLSGKMGGLHVDTQFNNNIKGATDNGIPVGVYRYGYAMTVQEAQREAIETVNAIKNSGYRITYPVAYDVEDSLTQGTLTKAQLTSIIKAYQGVIENHGYKFMIYSSKNWFENKLDMSQFSGEDLWLARWFLDGSPYHDHGYTGPGNVTLWQYSEKGTVPGIKGNVDMNVGYVRY